MVSQPGESFDSALDLALLNAELKRRGYEAVACSLEPDKILFHVRLPSGKIAGRFGGAYGADARGAVEYAEHAESIARVDRASRCSICRNEVFGS